MEYIKDPNSFLLVDADAVVDNLQQQIIIGQCSSEKNGTESFQMFLLFHDFDTFEKTG